MKRILLIPILVMILACCAAANPACITGNSLQQYMADYNGLANACSIGNLLFFNFNYTSSATGGATPVPASSIHVADVTDPLNPLNPGIQFQIGGYFAAALQSRDGSISYDIATVDGGIPIDDADLRIVGSITRGTGSLTGTEHLYFPGTSTDINPGSPIVDVYPSSSFTHINFIDFGNPFFPAIDITTAIHVAADAGSFATMSAVEQHFSQQIIPEPYGFLLVGSGLLCLVTRKWRARAGR